MDSLYLEPQGFLGTGASLLADLTLIAYIFLIVPGMLAGWVMARRGAHRPQHKFVMNTITLVNWVLILLLMMVAYNFDIADNIGEQPGNARYLVPTIHALLGIPAQLLATYIVFRMWREDTQVARAKQRGETDFEKYWFKNAKWMMQLTLALWLATAAFGVITYTIRYDVIDGFNFGDDDTSEIAPVATEDFDSLAPVSTEDVDAPIATEEATPEATTEVTEEMTEEAPVSTEEDEPPMPTPEPPAATEDAEAPASTEEAG